MTQTFHGYLTLSRFSCTGAISLHIILFFTNHGVARELCTADEATGGVCVTYQSGAGALTWSDAADYCAQNYQDGYLAMIENEVKQSYMESLMPGDGINEAWIGGKLSTTNLWYWQDGTIIEPQGCYLDDPNDRDLPTEISFVGVPSVFLSLCIARCRLRDASFTYAALQNGEECFCGHSFGRHSGLTTGCTIPCRGNEQMQCGGLNKNYIYRITGSYAEWADNQPNNHNGNQKCAAVDEFNNFDFVDEPCSRNAHYICEIEIFSNCEALTTNTSGGRYVTDGARCLFLADLQKSFFNAKMDCISRNGDLVIITSGGMKDRLATLINVNSVRISRYHWIGLTRFNLFWQNGDYGTYTNYAPSALTDDTEKCLAIQEDNAYMWTDHSCTQMKPFFCQYDLASQSTTTAVSPSLLSTTSISTNSMSLTRSTPLSSSTIHSPSMSSTEPTSSTSFSSSTTILTTASGGSGGAGQPNSNKSKQDESDQNTVYIVMLVICALLLVGIVVVIVVVCLLRKKKEEKKRKNKAQSEVYAESAYVTNSKPKRQVEMRSQSTATLQSELGDAHELRVHMTSPDHVKITSVRNRTCPKCYKDVKSLWKHLITKHGVEPGSAQLHDLMSQGKGHTAEEGNRKSDTRDIGRPPRGSISTRDRTLGSSLRDSIRGSKQTSRTDFRRNKIGVSTEEEESNEDSGNETLGRKKGKRDYIRASKRDYGRQQSTDDEIEQSRSYSRRRKASSYSKRDVMEDENDVTKTEDSDETV